MIDYVTFLPIHNGSRVKVFVKRKFHGYIESSKLFMLFTPEEMAVYTAGQVRLVVDYGRFKPHVVRPTGSLNYNTKPKNKKYDKR